MGLNKKQTYKYIKELLSSEIRVVKDIKSFETVISTDDLTLDNIVLNDERESITVYNAVKYIEKYRQLIDDNAKSIREFQIQLESYEDEFGNEYNQKIAELNTQNNQYNVMIDKMEKVYTSAYSMARDGLQDSTEEVVFISHLIESENLKIKRELISRPLQFVIDKNDYSVEISLMDIVRLEIDMLPIQSFSMYSEVKEIGDNLDVDDIPEKIESVLDLIKVSFSDVQYDKSFKQIIKRKKNLISTIEDYENIIEAVSDDEELDELRDTQNQSYENSIVINENELYLPLPANDQQKEIAYRLSTGSVAVQGPPGTGKTHTIINIISHMLALGKTILVVSEKMDALNVIKEKMPKQLQPLVMPMLGGAIETRKLTEDSIKNIINKKDSLNVNQERKAVELLKEKKVRLQEELSITINNQINSYVLENEDLMLYGETKKLSDWMRSIDIENIQLDDCEQENIEIDRYEIIKLLNYDMELLNNIVKNYIESKLLLSETEINDIILFSKEFKELNIFTLTHFNSSEVLIKDEYNFDNIFLHWYLNDEEYKIDKESIEKYDELSMQKTKYMRVLLDNEIIVPENIKLTDIEKLINKARESTGLITKLSLNFAKDIIINGEKFWKADNNIEILEQYYQNKKNMIELEKLKNRFISESYFGTELSSMELKEICRFYEGMKYVDVNLKNHNCEFMINKHRDSNYNLTDNYKLLLRAIKASKKLSMLKDEVELKLEKYDEISVAFQEILEPVINSKDKYQKFCSLVNDREQKYAASQEILSIKLKIDNVSKSLYSKLISGDCDETILDVWKHNYIYSQVNKVSRVDYKHEIERLRREINTTNIEVVEKLAWLELVQHIGSNEQEAMQTWISLINKIGKGTGKRAPQLREQAKNEMDKIKHSIPVWITTRSQVADLFKFKNGDQFDLVIYDESSQSTITALNVLERGQRKLVVGDDKQISPSSFVSHDKVEKIRNNYFEKNQDAIIMHDTTLYDFAVAKYSTVNLREHFRCLPEIIKFSNELQYNGSMVPLRTINSKDRLEPVVESVFVETGYLTDDKSNIPEAKAVIEKIKGMVIDKRYDSKSIGVISLLGDKQDRLISSMLYDQIGTDKIEKHNIKVSNSSAFQGDERDIILLSMVIARKEQDEHVRTTALTKADDYKRYNVAASRAKDKMILFHSLSNTDIVNKECVRFKLLEFFENFDSRKINYEAAKPKFDSIFEEEIFIALNDKGYNVIPQYDSNGFKIDLVVEAKEGKLAIECDGERYHGRDQFEADFRRQAILERAGWTFYRIRGRDYFSNKSQTITKLLNYLSENNLQPYELIENPNIGEFQSEEPIYHSSYNNLDNEKLASENEEQLSNSLCADPEDEVNRLDDILEKMTKMD